MFSSATFFFIKTFLIKEKAIFFPSFMSSTVGTCSWPIIFFLGGKDFSLDPQSSRQFVLQPISHGLCRKRSTRPGHFLAQAMKLILLSIVSSFWDTFLNNQS